MAQMRGKKVAVLKMNKASQGGDALFAVPEDTNAVGILKYVGPDAAVDLVPGMKVVFGKDRQEINLEGAVTLVMDDSNILAIIKD